MDWRKLSIIVVLSDSNPLLKSEKKKTKLTSCTPTAFTCIPCKVIEKILTYRLLHYLKEKKFFTNAQCGLHQNRSTQDYYYNSGPWHETSIQCEERFVRNLFLIKKKKKKKIWPYVEILRSATASKCRNQGKSNDVYKKLFSESDSTN